MKYTIQEINSIAKDMKYEALYWALGFEETTNGIFVKKYKELLAIIDSNKQVVDYNSKITIVNGKYLTLNSHDSFVVLECVDKLLSMGYLPSEIIIDLDNEYDIYCQNLYIRCFEWNHEKEDESPFKKDVFKSITYTSRLISGVIERKYSVALSTGEKYNQGIFEDVRKDNYQLSNSTIIENSDFEIKDNICNLYTGKSKKVIIPDGVKGLSAGLFWDNQQIEEVILPETLENISGDTFYNCTNLKKVIIPKNVKAMGNNPFAGCPELELDNESPFFNYENKVLYTKDYSRLIYCAINKKEKSYIINPKTKIIGKHSFYLCDSLEKIVIPESVIKLENNPFSGCTKLDVENHSPRYHIVDKVIYNSDKDSAIGCLNSIETECLNLLSVKRICRNAFWNCKGIRKIVLPKTLEKIGYNPFVGCSNIEFHSLSQEYVVDNGVLYTKDKEKIVCYPQKCAIGDVFIRDEVTTIERGAFSGCEKMTNINLHNVSVVNKSSFTNCNSLKKVYCSDIVGYIGEWAFAHCKNLQEISVYKGCFIDKNVISNTNALISIRENRSNYVIESDNLPTIKSMTKTYENKIKAILIDPPYNSNIDGIGYQDNYESDQYYSFIIERLKISFQLLTEDGFLVISIDENGLRNIEQMCKKVFGNNVKTFKWEKLHPFFDQNRKVDPNKKVVPYEYIVVATKSKLSKFNKIKQPFIKNDKLDEKDATFPKVFRCFGTNSSAKDEIEKIFGDRNYFRTPKPLKLIKELIRATTDKDSIVLDFFAGSGTTGHATVELNKEDGGTRKYVLVSNDESNICKSVTLKRMKMFDDSVVFLE